MTALLSKRREDFELLEDNMRKRFIEKSDLDVVRQELNELRQEIQELRTNKQQQNQKPISSLSTHEEQNIVAKQHPHQKQQQHGNQETNDHLTVKWLSDTVNELRTELNEIQYSHNMSVQLEQRSQIQNDMKLLHTDIINMNKELEGVRTEQLKYEATLGQLMEEVTSVRDSERTTAVQCAKVKSQLKAAQLEWSYNWQQIPKNPNQKTKMDTVSTISTPSNILPRKSRHQRVMRNHILKLEKTHADMSRQQTLLKEKILALEDLINEMSKNKLHNKRATIDLKEIDNRIHVIETRMNHIEKDSNTVGVQTDVTNNEINEDNNNILARVNRLEAIEKQQTVSLFNISQQVTSFDRLHRSILELLETVEQLENKKYHS
ncbi:protein scabrous-like [Chrysoperla carnea]|uniref:protein scabrous-like n=1 Tax=Chrysoperla carnea TaxID=189513 RepID=UPI001D08C854|nr:protein scabrous-like [Chrysoperla carnea]